MVTLTRLFFLCLIVTTPAGADPGPWGVGGTLQAGEMATLIIEGNSGAGTGYDVVVADYDGDGEADLIIAEPWSDPGDGTAGGRIGIILGPLTCDGLGVSPGEQRLVTLDDADEVLVGPSGAMLGYSLFGEPVGEGGPPLAVGAPGLVAASPIADSNPVAARAHVGEVWLFEGGDAPAGPIPAEERLSARLWWDGQLTGDADGARAELPLDLGSALDRVPDLDGDGIDELAISAPTLLSLAGAPAAPPDPLSSDGSPYRGGGVLIVPGSRILDGWDGAVDAAWVLAVPRDPSTTVFPRAAQALLGAPPGWGGGLAMADVCDEDLEGRIVLVDGPSLGAASGLVASDPSATALPADELGAAIEAVGIGMEFQMGGSLTALQGGDYLTTTSVQMWDYDVPRPVTTLFEAGPLSGLEAGQSVLTDGLESWILVGSSWAPATLEESSDWLGTVVQDGWGDVAGTYANWDACLAGGSVASCMPPLLAGAGLTPRVAPDMPRSFHVARSLGSAVLIGEPTADTPFGEVYVVEGDLEAGSPEVVRLVDDTTWPDGWQITRIRAGSEARWLGHAPVAPGDLDGDGFDDLVLGAPGITGSSDSGRVYLLLSAPHADLDQDGHTLAGGDCDDEDATVHPGAAELCNGVDDDCNGVVDDPPDADADGYTICDGECDDGDTAIHPGATELCDGVDNDCSGIVDDPPDADGDGVDPCHGDCDDGDPEVHPGAEEIADSVDNDCDGWIDEGVVSRSGCGCTDSGRPVEGLLPFVLIVALGWRKRELQ